MHLQKNTGGWTLIEVIVGIIIFSFFLTSIVGVIFLVVYMTQRNDISRAMQENVKNMIEILSEDIRLYGIRGISNSSYTSWWCEITTVASSFTGGTKLCIWENQYYIAQKVADSFVRVDNMEVCKNQIEPCFFIRKNGRGDIDVLHNNIFHIQEMHFYLFDSGTKRVVLQAVFQPRKSAGIPWKFIQGNTIHFQTTLSQYSYH